MTRTIHLTSLRELLEEARAGLQAAWQRIVEPFVFDFEDFEPEPVEDRDVYDELLRRA